MNAERPHDGDEDEEINREAMKGREIKAGSEDDESNSTTILVMQESENRSVWAYEVQSKGIADGWIVDQIAEDLDTVGLKNDRVVIKSDQEPAIIEVMRSAATPGVRLWNCA